MLCLRFDQSAHACHGADERHPNEGKANHAEVNLQLIPQYQCDQNRPDDQADHTDTNDPLGQRLVGQHLLLRVTIASHGVSLKKKEYMSGIKKGVGSK